MQLLMSPASPFVRKVRVLLRETGQIAGVEERPVVTVPFDTPPALASANPVGKIPALIRDDGPAIHDSRVICRYLDAQHHGHSLYPAARLWEILTLEATADGIMEAAVAMVYEARFRAPDQQSPEWVAAQWAKAERSIAAIESRWMPLLRGPLNMAQIAVACALAYVDFRHDARDWKGAHPALADWAEAFGARPSMVETRPQ